MMKCLFGVFVSFLLTAIDANLNSLSYISLPDSASSNQHNASEQLQLLINFSNFASRLRVQRYSSENSACQPEQIQVRREWGMLNASERIAYTNAVRCLQSKSARSDPLWAPGAKTRFDDWVATHINQTLSIHYSGTFLAWHRWFTWEYEQSLRRECGYSGTQPYWNWGLTAITGLESSPIWDGSSTSMGGNGERINQTGKIVLTMSDLPDIVLSTGTGGGCVTTGPFANMTVNLGPNLLALPGNRTDINPNGPLSYDPRCLKRDLTNHINQVWSNATAIVNTILIPQDIYSFQMTMQGWPNRADFGIHGGGHYAIGGDPARDVYVSPGDPAFYLHHSMIDLVWYIWQALDYDERTFGNNSISGTGTFLNNPPSPNTTFDTPISIGRAGQGKGVTMRDLMSTTSGPFCYVYE